VYWYRAPFVSSVLCKALVVALALIIPAVSLAASLFVSPRSGTYSVGDTFSVGIVVEASDTPFNAVSGSLTFPTGAVEVVSLSKTSSVISLWVQEPSFSNSAGTVSFEGIVLNPGYKGSNARILTVQFRAKKEGTVPLTFTSSDVLANDGVGTSILSSAGKGSYAIVTKVVPPVIEQVEPQSETSATPDTEDITPNAPLVRSDSHKPDQWSNQTTGTFAFDLGEDIMAVRLLVDDKADSMPTVVHQPAIKERSIEGLTEGTSYLHVQFKNSKGWGDVIHYHLQIDTKQPEALEITESVSTDTKTFSFTAMDTLSGIGRFEVSLDGGAPEVIIATDNSVTYTTPVLTAGRHLLTVKAFDKAGNEIQSSREFTTTEQTLTTGIGGVFPVPENLLDFGKITIVVLSLLVPTVALLGFLLWLLFSSWKFFGGFKRRLKKETEEAKAAVRKSFGLLLEDLGEDVKTLQKAGTKRALTKEEIKVLKRLHKHIALTEAFIYKEISDIEDEVDSIPSLADKSPKSKNKI
jgi:hypothetical protein